MFTTLFFLSKFLFLLFLLFEFLLEFLNTLHLALVIAVRPFAFEILFKLF
jgi:hypothetical protein